MARIAEHLGVRLSPGPTSLLCPTRHIMVDTYELGESQDDSTSSGDDSQPESAPF